MDAGGYTLIIVLLCSCGSLFGVPIKVPSYMQAHHRNNLNICTVSIKRPSHSGLGLRGVWGCGFRVLMNAQNSFSMIGLRVGARVGLISRMM